jgi:hypothetical protein
MVVGSPNQKLIKTSPSSTNKLDMVRRPLISVDGAQRSASGKRETI